MQYHDTFTKMFNELMDNRKYGQRVGAIATCIYS